MAEPGQPQAETLHDVGDHDSDGATPDTDAASALGGQFVGGGAAAIGTWSISASTDMAENLTASFGVEKGEEVPEDPPTVTGGGESMTAISGTGRSAVNAKGVITLVAADNTATPPVTAITVKGADLFDSGGTTINGSNFVDEAEKEIMAQLERLNAFIALDGLGGNETVADAGRDSVWTALAAALDPIVGTGSGATVFGAAYPGTNADDDSQRDADAKDLIAKVLDALSTLVKFRAAVLADGTLADGATRLIDGNPAAVKMVFDRVDSTTTVEYGSTAYTRFGAWNRVTAENAEATPTEPGTNGNGVFAYSPLAATAYSTTDPNFPGGGTASYEGSTIARGGTTYYEGDIKIGVTWAANVDTATNVGIITASIENLRTDKGALFATDKGNVDTIIFTDTDITVVRDDTGSNTLSFTDTGGGVRLRYTDIRLTDETGTGDIDGLFVGKVIDGPLGIIGGWSISAIDSGDALTAAYGADLMP